MKKICYAYVVVVAFLSTTTAVAQKGNIELEPRVGYIHSDIPEYQSGFQVGARSSFGLSERFSITPGLSFASFGKMDKVYFLVPVYASYQIPLQECRLHLNAGPYGQFGPDQDFGVSAEVSAEYKRWQLGAHYYQNLIGGESYAPDRFAGLSVGYRFRVR